MKVHPPRWNMQGFESWLGVILMKLLRTRQTEPLTPQTWGLRWPWSLTAQGCNPHLNTRRDEADWMENSSAEKAGRSWWRSWCRCPYAHEGRPPPRPQQQEGSMSREVILPLHPHPWDILSTVSRSWLSPQRRRHGYTRASAEEAAKTTGGWGAVSGQAGKEKEKKWSKVCLWLTTATLPEQINSSKRCRAKRKMMSQRV